MKKRTKEDDGENYEEEDDDYRDRLYLVIRTSWESLSIVAAVVVVAVVVDVVVVDEARKLVNERRRC